MELLAFFEVGYRRQVPIANYVVDFLVGEKTVVEVFGGYWHKRPSSVKRDTVKFERLRSMGYSVIVLWQDKMHFWWKDLQSLK
jgi:very-short-patch-repair endonuclease